MSLYLAGRAGEQGRGGRWWRYNRRKVEWTTGAFLCQSLQHCGLHLCLSPIEINQTINSFLLTIPTNRKSHCGIRWSRWKRKLGGSYEHWAAGILRPCPVQLQSTVAATSIILSMGYRKFKNLNLFVLLKYNTSSHQTLNQRLNLEKVILNTMSLKQKVSALVGLPQMLTQMCKF